MDTLWLIYLEVFSRVRGGEDEISSHFNPIMNADHLLSSVLVYRSQEPKPKTQQCSTAKQRFAKKGVQWLHPLCTGTPTGNNNGFPFLDILGHRVFKEYPQKSQIWKSETSPNQGTWLGIP